jgi:hypothetical protein
MPIDVEAAMPATPTAVETGLSPPPVKAPNAAPAPGMKGMPEQAVVSKSASKTGAARIRVSYMISPQVERCRLQRAAL